MRGLLLLAVLLTGCAAAPVPATSDALPPGTAPATAKLAAVTLVDHHVVLLGVEWDVLCSHGGGPELERTGALIPAGARRLIVTTDVSPTYTSLQVGYAIDDEAVTWLAPVSAGASREEVPLPAGAGEADGPRWRFYYQLNLPAAPQDCYTGAGAGERAIRIEASP